MVIPKQADNLPETVTRYDRVAGALVTLLFLIGPSVLLLALVVFLQQGTRLPTVVLSTTEATSGQGREVEFWSGLETPDWTELSGVPDAAESADLPSPTTLEYAVAAAASWEVSRSMDAVGPVGTPHLSRPVGGPEHDSIVPRWERWEVRFDRTSLSRYVQQLDFFQIELGAVGGSPLIDYASGFSGGRASMVRSGPSREEPRLYMSWKQGALGHFDRQLLERAGIPTKGRVILQFYSSALEDQLAWVEMEAASRARHRDVRQIYKTVFGVRPVGTGFEFTVLDQRYRPQPN